MTPTASFACSSSHAHIRVTSSPRSGCGSNSRRDSRRAFRRAVVSPVPWCPPVPDAGPMRQYARFRRIPVWEHRGTSSVTRPRFFVGPGTSLYRFEARAYLRGVQRAVDRLHRTCPSISCMLTSSTRTESSRMRSRRRLKVPFVVTEHAPWTGWLDRPGIGRQALAAAFGRSCAHAGEQLGANELASLRGCARRTEVIPVGVDESTFRPSANTRRRPGQVLFVGLINYMKGIDVLLDAVRRLGESTAPPSTSCSRAVAITGTPVCKRRSFGSWRTRFSSTAESDSSASSLQRTSLDSCGRARSSCFRAGRRASVRFWSRRSPAERRWWPLGVADLRTS